MTEHAADSHNSGFTMIELLVVVAMLALMSTLVYSTTNRSHRQTDLRATAEILASQLRHTRARALKNNSSAVLVYDSKQRRYWIEGQQRVHHIPKTIGVKFQTLQKERLSGSRARLRYHVDGSASGGSFVLISERAKATVQSDWMTGAVSVKYSTIY